MNDMFGICNLTMVPVRTEPAHRSEMSSQLLFGDHFEILDKKNDWVQIKNGYDDYQGWILGIQYHPVDQATYVQMHDLRYLTGMQLGIQLSIEGSQNKVNLVPGCNLPEVVNDRFNLGGIEYEISQQPVTPEFEKFDNELVSTAKFYLNSPYLWGGKTPFGIDCSGFCQMVFKQFGIRLKRDAYQQAEQGTNVDFLQEANAGDLAFFDNDEGRITHVGIMLSSSEIIHASGRVKIDKIDNQGIYSEEQNKYTHKLRIIKRII